jgi:hypothetical protein
MLKSKIVIVKCHDEQDEIKFIIIIIIIRNRRSILCTVNVFRTFKGSKLTIVKYDNPFVLDRLV